VRKKPEGTEQNRACEKKTGKSRKKGLPLEGKDRIHKGAQSAG